MKKKLALFFTVILAMACVLSGCGGKDKKTSGKKIGVIQMIENGAFNDMRDGILEEMKAKGYENVVWLLIQLIEKGELLRFF